MDQRDPGGMMLPPFFIMRALASLILFGSFLGLLSATGGAQDKARRSSWGVNPVKWYVENYPAGMDHELADEIFSNAFFQWSAVCNLDFERTEEPDEANIRILFDPTVFGGQANFPPVPLYTGRVTIKLNGATDYSGRGESLAYSYLQPILTHEIGHAIGIAHSQRTDQLMSVAILGVDRPQWEDKQESQRIYGVRFNPNTPQRPGTLKQPAFHRGQR